MIIQHTVVFALVHSAESTGERDFLVASRDALTDIPGVKDFVVSRQVSAKSELTWQFSMTFADQDAYDHYNRHPVHQDYVASRWVHEVAEFQEFDFVALPA